MPYDLYILYSQKIDRYYIGISSNAEKRLFSHNNFPKRMDGKRHSMDFGLQKML